MKNICVITILLSVFIINGSCSRILGFFPSPSKSHLIIHMSVVRPLLERGHDVTVVTTIPLNYSHQKLRHVYLPDVPGFPKNMLERMINEPKTKTSTFSHFPEFVNFLLEHGNNTLNSPEMKKFLNDPKNVFDLVLLGSFMNDFHLGVASHFKCPVILIWMVQPVYYVNYIVGNPLELAYVPSLFSQEAQPMNFLGRVKNFLIGRVEALAFIYMKHKMQICYDYNFPPEKYRSFDETLRNVSLVFTAHHFSLGPIRPNVPGLIEIGGIQVDQKPKPLSKELQTFLDSATDGAVYFCMGSNVPTSALRPESIKAIFNVFKNLKQKVVMKWEGDKIPVKSNNIFHSKWLPQSDVLSHPNIKVFITHGGNGGMMEAKYRSVPIIGLPVFADQLPNVEKAQREGWGLYINIDELNEDNLKSAIVEVINNPSYKNRVQFLSNLYRDRIATPQETVVFWAEYVIRHHGAAHMQSPAVHMNLIEYYSVDVITFLVITIYLMFKTLAFVVKRLYRLIFKSKANVKVKQN